MIDPTNIYERWQSVAEDEYLRFDLVHSKRSQRPDLHAFLLLDELFPGTRDIVSGTSHDEIWLSISDEETATLTDEQIIELSRCGVRFDEDGELCMFV